MKPMEVSSTESLRKGATVLACVFAMVSMFAHTFPSLIGFSTIRKATDASFQTLGIHEKWRMFTTKDVAAVPLKMELIYTSGKTKVVVLRAERVSFSRSAENRYGETVLWNTRSPLVGAFLAASCRRYASTDDPLVSASLNQAIITLPTTLTAVETNASPQYQQVRSLQCPR